MTSLDGQKVNIFFQNNVDQLLRKQFSCVKNAFCNGLIMESDVKAHKAVCAVAICPSPKDETVIYHRFPKNKEARKKWIFACKRDDKNLNPCTASVCSNHFLAADYERDLRNELLGLPVRKKLNRDAIPSQKLRSTSSADTSFSGKDRDNRQLKRQQKKLVENLLCQKDDCYQTENVSLHCKNYVV